MLAVLSSRMGSIGAMDSNRSWLYRTSKAAVNAVPACRWMRARPPVSRCTRWVRTDMGGSGADLAVEDSVGGMRRVLAGASRADNGSFHAYDGAELPR